MVNGFKKILIFAIILTAILIHASLADEVEEITENDIEEIIETVSNSTENLDIASRFAVAFDRTSKKVLWSKNENEEVPMASTTKIITAVILMENYVSSLNTEVEICKEAACIGGSRLGLKTGDKITLNDLLYGMMLCSGNDAAVQIAITVSGNIENFAELMNSKVKELGLEHTHFTCPHGLDNPNHYTTAYELALITDYALNNPKIAEVVNTKDYTVTINGYPKTITNTNELLGYLEGVNGVKTGFTNGAGRCLVTSTLRNNFNIIVVVLGADTKKVRTKDSIIIINYIYDTYELVNIEEKIILEYENWKTINERRIEINKGRSDYLETILGEIKYAVYPIKKDKVDDINVEIKNLNYFEAPVEKNKKIGEIKVVVAGEELETVEILNKKTIFKNNILDYLVKMMECIQKFDYVYK